MAEHRHVFTVHRHSEWLGHSVEGLPGYKPADRWHTHFWWRHDHSHHSVTMGLAAAVLAFAFVVGALGTLALLALGVIR